MPDVSDQATHLTIGATQMSMLRPLAADDRNLLMQDDVIGCDDSPLTLITPSVLPVLSDDASPRDRRRHEVLSDAVAGNAPATPLECGHIAEFIFRSTSSTSR